VAQTVVCALGNETDFFSSLWSIDLSLG